MSTYLLHLLRKFLARLPIGTAQPLQQDRSGDDSIIVVLGPTGAGKSTFINAIVGEEVAPVGHGLSTCTQKIEAYEYKLPQDPGKTVLLVDTPGFDDTAMHDSTRVFKWIVQWAAEHQARTGGKNSPSRIAAFIYLQDISQKRINNRQNIDFSRLQQLLGEVGSDSSYSKLFLVTYQWPLKPSSGSSSPSSAADTKTTAATTRGSASQSLVYQQAEDREKELENKFWKDLLQKGAKMLRVEDSVLGPARALLDILKPQGHLSSG